MSFYGALTRKYCSLSFSGGASAAKEPGHFEVRTSSSQVTRMRFFPQKSWRPFLVVALETQRPPMPLRLFHCQNKTKRSAVRHR